RTFSDPNQTYSRPVRSKISGRHGRTIASFYPTKVGFVTFSHSIASPTSGFVSGVSDIANGGARFALYPGGGIEALAGPIGIRLEVGDDIYFLGGARNNLKANIGPSFVSSARSSTNTKYS